MAKPGYVYFISETGSDFVKIGMTQGYGQIMIEGRLKELQTANPRELVVAGQVAYDDVFMLENLIH